MTELELRERTDLPVPQLAANDNLRIQQWCVGFQSQHSMRNTKKKKPNGSTLAFSTMHGTFVYARED